MCFIFKKLLLPLFLKHTWKSYTTYIGTACDGGIMIYTIQSAPPKPRHLIVSVISSASSKPSPLASLDLDGLLTWSSAIWVTDLTAWCIPKTLWGGDKHGWLPCSGVRLSPEESQMKDLIADLKNLTEQWNQGWKMTTLQHWQGWGHQDLAC